MKPLQLKSETQVYLYLKNFVINKPKAIQLDGSLIPTKSNKVMIVFRYSINDQKYKLLGNLSRQAIDDFIALTREQGSPALALKEFQENGRTTLILADSSSPNGWSCEKFTIKRAGRVNNAA